MAQATGRLAGLPGPVMDFKHSQGRPWSYCQNTECGPCGNIYMGVGRWVGQAFGRSHAADLCCSPKNLAGVDEQMANLRLMAASPTMLLALTTLMQATDDRPISDLREIARRAVQKATIGAQEIN